MWLVFVFVILIFGIYFSKIKFSISKINISKNIFEFRVKISFYLFSKIKIFSIYFNEKGIKVFFIFIPYKKILRKINMKEKITYAFDKIDLRKIKKLNISLEKLDMKCIIGIDDIIINVAIVTLIASIIGFYLSRKKGKYRYTILPDFGKNIIIFEGSFAFSLKTRRIRIFFKPKEHTKFNKLLVGG